ncbi:siderophore-interacting protein [Leifsonia aquatica]|uniref:siderophore-interacting protein n=1 Tax=Leifsonia aquatica TaxID=144185 RepID=UPI00382E5CB9
MSTTAPTRTDRPAYRPYRARVSAVQPLSPHFTRVSFRSDDFEHFGTEGLDQRIKLLFPLADGTFSDLGFDDEESIAAGDWYERWRALPEHLRNPFRTYTVRVSDPADRRVDIDFVSHGDGGPAARWLLAAAPGDELVIVGPDARSTTSGVGIDWHPGGCTDLLIVGDETAVPAIAAILASRPDDCTAHVFLEVPSRDDALTLQAPAGVTITWLARGDDESGSALVPAVERWLGEHPEVVARAAADGRQRLEKVDIDRDVLWELGENTETGFYAWIAGESAAVKTLRRLLVRGHGIDRHRVAFMGYWRMGRAEN